MTFCSISFLSIPFHSNPLHFVPFCSIPFYSFKIVFQHMFSCFQPIFIQYLVISRDSTDNVEHGTDSNRVINLHDEKTSYKIALLATTVHECSLLMKRIESAKDAYKKIEIVHQQNKRKSCKYLISLKSINISLCCMFCFCRFSMCQSNGRFSPS